MIPEIRSSEKDPFQEVQIGIRGTEFVVVGEFNSDANVVTNLRVEHNPGAVALAKTGKLGEKPVDQVWTINSKEDVWELHLKGYKKDGLLCDSFDVKRSDGAQWSYMLTDSDGPTYESYDLVMSRAQGYMAPIFRPNEGREEIKGKRIIAIEPRSKSDYVGVVAPSIRFDKENRKIDVFVQNAKNTTPELEAYSTIRLVRGSVDNPDYDKIRPVAGVIQYPLHEVDLHPDLIASAEPGSKLRVKNFVFEHATEAQAPEGQKAVSLEDYIDASADGVGLAALYQFFVAKFSNNLSTHEEGMNMESANYPTDSNESYGKPIRIGLLKGKNVWKVIVENKQNGKFNREGEPIPAIVGRNFDPNKVDAEAVQVHKLKPVNPNNARETGTRTSDGLHPVEIYIYEQSMATLTLESQNLCDFAKSGDGPAQMALMEWLGHTYLEVFKNNI